MKEEVLTRLDALGAKLNVVGGKLWEAAVSYSWAQGVSDLTLALVGASVTGLLIYGVLHFRKVALAHVPKGGLDETRGNNYAVALGCAGASILSLVVTMSYLRDGIINVLAPEGAALKLILEHLR